MTQRNEQTEIVAQQLVDAAVMVHRHIGPGILENAYHACLLMELRHRCLDVRSNVELPVVYRGARVRVGYRVDLIVEGLVLAELKAVTKVLPIHEAQVLTYLRLSGTRVGFLLNFHAPLMKEGITRLVNGW
jgi:GxxExxY protein